MTNNTPCIDVKMQKIYQAISDITEFSEYPRESFAPHDEAADKIAYYLGRKMKTNQLRKVFSEIKRIEILVQGKDNKDDFKNSDLLLLLPQIAYAKARDLIQPDFYEIVKLIIGKGGGNTKIKKIGDFKRFVEFMTAIVAYHKQYAK